MTTAFPTALDALTNPTGADTLGTAAVLHSSQHANANDAIEAIEAAVGVTGSAVSTSLRYRADRTNRGYDYVVAANDATAYVKAMADYVCDGTADEVQINLALAALPATGGCVKLSAGSFNVATPVLMIRDSTELIGSGIGPHDASTQLGRGTTIRAASGFTGDQVILVQHSGDARPLFGGLIRDLTVNGADEAGPIDGIVFRSNMGELDRLQVVNCTGNGVRVKGYGSWDTYDTRLVNLMCSFNGLAGILMDDDSPDGHILGCVLQQNQDGIRIRAGSTQLLGGQYYGNDRYNIFFDNTGSQSMVDSVKIENAGEHGIFIDSTTVGPTGIGLRNCGFRLNGKATNNTYDHICISGAQSVPNLTITGNRFSSSPSTDPDLPRYGVNLSSTVQNACVVGNTFARPTATHFGTAAINYGPGSGASSPSLVRSNSGAPALGCRGTGTVGAAATSVNITHNLAYTPNTDDINITPTNIPTNAPLSWAVTAATSTTFTLTLSGVPGASTFTFSWQVG